MDKKWTFGAVVLFCTYYFAVNFLLKVRQKKIYGWFLYNILANDEKDLYRRILKNNYTIIPSFVDIKAKLLI